VQQFFLPLARVVQETPDVKTFKLDLVGQELEYQAGQHLYMDLVVQDPRGSRRPFTISSSPTEPGFISITTRIGSSPFKQTLNGLKIGERVKIKAPNGDFLLHSDLSRSAIFLAGGIGITPFRSMIKFATDKMLPVKISLLYSNRSYDQITFREEFERLSRLNQNLNVFHTLSLEQGPDPGWKGLTSWIDQAKIKQSVPDFASSTFYVCGPPGFTVAMSGLLQKISIAGANIRTEEFSGY